MNSFEIVLRDSHVNDQSTSPADALLFAILSYGKNVGFTGDELANPVDDVLLRLTNAGAGKNAIDIVSARLNTLRERYSR